MEKGVSIVICCYNSASLLPDTIKSVCNIKMVREIKSEVIIVNNASSDNTAKIAQECLIAFKCPVNYRIINEDNPGLSNARKKGINDAEYEYIIFCDDDNRLAPDYVEKAFDIMESDMNIGIAGGVSSAEPESPLPDWFEKYKTGYSVGKQFESSGDVTDKNSVLWGAGMIVRNSAMKELYSNGFQSLLTDRRKKELSSGGDSEFCYAMKLSGYRILYDERLKLKHFLPSFRLKWEYLRKLNREFGAQKIYFEPYIKLLKLKSSGQEFILSESWKKEAIRLIKKLRGYGFKKLTDMMNLQEGNEMTLRIEKTYGRLKELVKIKEKYELNFRLLENAQWIKR